MTEQKLYALTDQQVEFLRYCSDPNVMGFGPLAGAADEFLTPLVVPGTAAERLMKVHSKHMEMRTSGAGWVCTECGHAYNGPISKPQAWAHAFACVLAALTTQEDQS